VQSLQHHDEPSRDHRVVNRYVGNLAPTPGVFYPARQRLDRTKRFRKIVDDAWHIPAGWLARSLVANLGLQ
jgi:hypothetical protein